MKMKIIRDRYRYRYRVMKYGVVQYRVIRYRGIGYNEFMLMSHISLIHLYPYSPFSLIKMQTINQPICNN